MNLVCWDPLIIACSIEWFSLEAEASFVSTHELMFVWRRSKSSSMIKSSVLDYTPPQRSLSWNWSAINHVCSAGGSFLNLDSWFLSGVHSPKTWWCSPSPCPRACLASGLTSPQGLLSPHWPGQLGPCHSQWFSNVEVTRILTRSWWHVWCWVINQLN